MDVRRARFAIERAALANTGYLAMEFTPIEREILDWFARESGDPILAEQLKVARPVKREFSGGWGSFTELEVPQHMPRVTFKMAPSHIEPFIVAPELKYGASCLLFATDGLVSMLETASIEQDFPESFTTWKLVGPDNPPMQRTGAAGIVSVVRNWLGRGSGR